MTPAAAPRPPLSEAEQTRLRRIIATGLSLAVVGSAAPIPLYPIYRSQLGLDAFTMTVIFIVYVAAVLCALLIAPTLLSRLRNAYRLLLPGLGLVALGACVIGGEQGLSWLLIGRMLAGLGTGLVTSSSNALMIELAPNGDVRHAAMVSTLAFGAGSAVGPIFSGVLLQLGWWPLLAPFVGVALSALIVLWLLRHQWHTLAASTHVSSVRPASADPGAAPAAVPTSDSAAPPPIPWRVLFVCAGVIFVGWGMGSVFMALGTYFGAALLGITNYAISGYAVSAMVLGGTISQWLHRHARVRPGLIFGCFIMAAGLLAQGAGAVLQSGWTVVVGMAITALGQGGALSCAAAMLQQSSPPVHRNRMISWFYMAGYVANTLPMALGAVSDTWGPAMAVAGFTCLSAGMLMAIGAYVWRKPAGLLG